MAVVSLDEAKRLVQEVQSRGAKVVLGNGAFDLLHVGHLRYLQAARDCGDFLVVAVNSDASVRLQKGPKRPLVPEAERVELVAALRCVDSVVMFADPTVAEVIDFLRPNIHAKGTDYTVESIPEAVLVKSYGGETRIVGDPKNHSTTAIVALLNEG